MKVERNLISQDVDRSSCKCQKNAEGKLKKKTARVLLVKEIKEKEKNECK